MKTNTLTKFVHHLIGCTDETLGKAEIEKFDVIRLRRELAQFKRHIDGNEPIDPVLLGRLMDLEIRVDESLLDDSKHGRLLTILALAFRGSSLVIAKQEQRREEARRQLARFKEDLDQVRFILEFPAPPSRST
jgi:hypothetical protein